MGELNTERIYEGDSKSSFPLGPADRVNLPANTYLVREDKVATQILDKDQENKFEIVDSTKRTDSTKQTDSTKPAEPAEKYTLHRGNPYVQQFTDLGKDLNYYRKGLLTNGYESVFGETLNPAQRYNSAINSLSTDRKTRTAKSMNSSIDKFVDLGMTEENIGARALLLNEADASWNQAYKDAPALRPGDKLLDHRAIAILTMATAEVNLQHGLVVPKPQPAPGYFSLVGEILFDNNSSRSVPNETATYILSDKQLDLGGMSLGRTFWAKKCIELAKEEATKQMGTTVDGTVVKRSELAELDAMNKRVDALHDNIQGKHDIAGAIQELSDYIAEDPSQGRAISMIRLSSNLDNRILLQAQKDETPERSELIAKLLRDQAVLKMALVSSSSSTHGPEVLNRTLLGSPKDHVISAGGQKYNLNSVQGCLQWSTKLDPKNVQLGDVVKEFNKLKTKNSH